MAVKIPMLDLRAQYAPIEEEALERIRQVFQSKRFILGPEVEKLEGQLSQFLGGPEVRCVGVSSGSDALLMALMALEVGPGDEVITTPFSFFATMGAILRVGATPVFADIREEDFNIDPTQVADKITSRTKVILPVHLYGQCALIEELQQVADHIPIVEDAAQALGASRQGKKAGTLGTIGCFSFYPTKNLGGITEGGLCTTLSPELAERLYMLRAHGSKGGYLHELVGGNFRMNAINATVLSLKLPHLEQWNEGRRQNAALYTRLFKESGLLEKELVVLPSCREGNVHIYHQFVIQVPQRDQLREYLLERGIQTAVYYPTPLHLQPCVQHLGFRKGMCPVAEAMADRVLALPIYPELTSAQIEEVVTRICEFYHQKGQ